MKAPIGTAQRINEWLSPSPELDRLAAACDLIGVNMYVCMYVCTCLRGWVDWIGVDLMLLHCTCVAEWVGLMI